MKPRDIEPGQKYRHTDWTDAIVYLGCINVRNGRKEMIIISHSYAPRFIGHIIPKSNKAFWEGFRVIS